MSGLVVFESECLSGVYRRVFWLTLGRCGQLRETLSTDPMRQVFSFVMSNHISPPRSLSLSAAAQTFGVSRPTVRRWMKNGLLKATRLGNGFWRVPPDEVRRVRRLLGDELPDGNGGASAARSDQPDTFTHNYAQSDAPVSGIAKNGVNESDNDQNCNQKGESNTGRAVTGSGLPDFGSGVGGDGPSESPGCVSRHDSVAVPGSAAGASSDRTLRNADLPWNR
ncbi:DNA binding domain, excisionase family [Fuerstiella marisgermanici]|uniref:DNA binding domain, excisionase family n=1 Tax=Fuerstiella marisgermanici TaxID=1891926 RepID=A0A1P8WDR3_9PLAN|nr:DNA binding domain, excisionase family [Fuerstiella marisgermanici]